MRGGGVVTFPSLCHNTSPALCHQANTRVNKQRERSRLIFILRLCDDGEAGGEQNREEKH